MRKIYSGRFKKVICIIISIVISMMIWPTSIASSGTSNNPDIGFLLRGFNVLAGKELSNATLSSARIIKKEFEGEVGSKTRQDNINTTEAITSSGRSIVEIASNTITNWSVNANAEVGLAKLFKASASGKYSNSVNKSYSNSTDSWYFSLKINHTENRNTIDYISSSETREIVQSALESSFFNDLTSAQNIKSQVFDKYGTHFLTGYNAGGWIENTMSVISSTNSISSETKNKIEASVSRKVGYLGFEESTSAAIDLENTLKENEKKEDYKYSSYSSIAGSVGGFFTNAEKVDDVVDKWLRDFVRVGDNVNTNIILDEGLNLTGIWELLPAGYEDRRNELIDAYIEESLKQDRAFYSEFLYKQLIMSTSNVELREVTSALNGPIETASYTTPDNAIQIYNQSDLNAIRNNPSGSYVLMNDISISGTWTPIPDFRGTLDGHGHRITGLYTTVNTSSGRMEYAGLFAKASGNATIKNTNIVIPSDQSVLAIQNQTSNDNTPSAGGFIGQSNGTVLIENCSVSGGRKAPTNKDKINGNNTTAQNKRGGVTALRDMNSRNAISYAGGLIGSVNGGNVTISKCFVTSDVIAHSETGESHIIKAMSGGLIGSVISGEVVIKDSYTSNGKVQATVYRPGTGNTGDAAAAFAGGLIGFNDKGSISIKNCYVDNTPVVVAWRANSGTVGTLTYAGDYIGFGDLNRDKSSFTPSDIRQQTEQSLRILGWNFDTVWQKNGTSLPSLREPTAVGDPVFVIQRINSNDVFYEGEVITLESLLKKIKIYFAANRYDWSSYQGVEGRPLNQLNLSIRYNFSSTGDRPIQLIYDIGNNRYVSKDIIVRVEPIPIDEKTPPPDNDVTVVSIPGIKNGIKLTATLTKLGIRFMWTPSDNKIGYRIYRSETPDGEGISISDFPLRGERFFDVNISSNTKYYYSIAPVKAEASFDRETITLVPEEVGIRSEILSINTGIIDIIPPPDERGFVMMAINDPNMDTNEGVFEIDKNRGTTPIIEAGRTMLPIRALVQFMNGGHNSIYAETGSGVEWHEENNSFELKFLDNTVDMWLGQKDFLINGQTNTMDIAPYTSNGRSMLPVRFVAESLGTQVEWIGSTQNEPDMVVIVFHLLPIEILTE